MYLQDSFPKLQMKKKKKSYSYSSSYFDYFVTVINTIASAIQTI